jgi:hypothetical protein
MLNRPLPKGTRVKADRTRSLPLNLAAVNGEPGELAEDFDPDRIDQFDPEAGLELHASPRVAVMFKRGLIRCAPAHLVEAPVKPATNGDHR